MFEHKSVTTRKVTILVELMVLIHPASCLLSAFCNSNVAFAHQHRGIDSRLFFSAIPKVNGGDDDWIYNDLEVLGDDEEDDEEDWIPDSVLAEGRRKAKHLTPAKEVIKADPEDKVSSAGATSNGKKVTSPYTEEEEQLIASMGGRSKKQSYREEGFLGDSTLAEIATDYSVPVCYLADVIASWGVPVPINIHDRLGDLVTGEQAFALVEAVNSLDIGALHDRYSNSNLLQLSHHWEMDLKQIFEFAMKEGWNLPFGVRTNLRVEQERELLRVFSSLYDQDEDED